MQIKFLGFMPSGEVIVIGSARLEDAQRQFGPDFTLDDLRELGQKGWKDQCESIVEMPQGWEPPTDRTFRNAWRKKGHPDSDPHPECELIDVNLPHAREIHRDWIRRKRIAKMAELDTAYMRADEENDQARKKEIAAEKRRLRDLPADPRIDAARTIEELKTIQA